MSELDPLEAYCSALLANLEPSSRRQLAREIGTGLRSSNAKRIAAQRNPDGSPYEPRKAQKLRRKKGSIRRGMFAKLRTARFLKMQASSESAVIKFAGEVERIAEVHHYGLRDKVNRRRSLEVQYPERKLLGIPSEDVSLVEDFVIEHLSR